MTTQDVVIGVLAIVVGALFCFRGAVAMRIVISLWGAFTGFMVGAGAVAGADGTGFLRTLFGWVVGFALALLFGALAYLYYQVAVTLAMAAIGFALGVTVMVALGVTWSWAVIGVGVIAGIVLAIVTLALDLPMVLLVVLSAFGGASAIVTGVMLLAGTVDAEQFTRARATQQMQTSWWWYAAYLALAVIGMVAQLRFLDSVRSSARDQWHRGAPAH